MTVHYIPVRNSERAACGRNIPLASRRAHTPGPVTCGRCHTTEVYANAVRRSTMTIPVDQAVDGAQEAIKTALDAVFESVHKAAEAAGYCSTYDELVDEATVPSWYTIPTRKEKFEIEVNYAFREGIVATDEDEAFRLIAENPRAYISLIEQ
ncbi:MAG: hypothetical protein ACOYB3_01945 [Azonexus sp.]